MKNSLLYLLIFTGIFSCDYNNKDCKRLKTAQSIDYSQIKKTEANSINSIDTSEDLRPYKKIVKFKYDDFEKFYIKFISDSIFQSTRVRFPIKGNYQDYDNEHTWTKSNWPNMNWDLRNLKNQVDSTSFIQTENKFFWGTYCLDCGFSFEMEFNKIDNEWFLVYRQENNF